MITRWNAFFLYFHLVFEIRFSNVPKVKRNISGAKKVTSKLSFRLFFQFFFLFFFFFFRKTPSILCIYSYKKGNIPEQGKKFLSLPLENENSCVRFQWTVLYSLNKIFEKIIIRIVPLIRSIDRSKVGSLMIKEIIIKLEQFSLNILFIHFEEKNPSIEVYIRVFPYKYRYIVGFAFPTIHPFLVQRTIGII